MTVKCYEELIAWQKAMQLAKTVYELQKKLPKEEIYLGGNSKARNPKMQTMLRMVGFGDNAGSGFPAILRKTDFFLPNCCESSNMSIWYCNTSGFPEIQTTL